MGISPEEVLRNIYSNKIWKKISAHWNRRRRTEFPRIICFYKSTSSVHERKIVMILMLFFMKKFPPTKIFFENCFGLYGPWTSSCIFWFWWSWLFENFSFGRGVPCVNTSNPKYQLSLHKSYPYWPSRIISAKPTFAEV